MSAPSVLQPPASLLSTQGVHLVGDFVSKCGLSQSARDIVEVIRHLGIPAEILDLPIFPEREAEKREQLKRPLSFPKPASRLSLFSFNADFVPAIAHSLPRHCFEDRYIIGTWFWETENFPPHHAAGLDYVDEIWVASQHIQHALQKISPVPVKLYTHLIHPPRLVEGSALPTILDNDRFVFLFCYDFRSMAERKNPAGTCEAFIKAFPEVLPGGPLCILKSVAAHPGHTMEFLDLQRRFRNRPDIIFIDGYLPAPERDALMNRADCYVSLHRAEGLGLTLLESMSLGKPCIGTAYSGNMDFMTPENSWLIPCRMVRVGPRHWPFDADTLWADPDLDAAAAAMREAWSHPEVRREKGHQAWLTATTRHHMDNVAAGIRSLLEEAMARPARPKPGLDAVRMGSTEKSSRTLAYESLRKAKGIHKEARSDAKSLKGLRVPAGLKPLLQKILEVQKLNQQTQQLILHELGSLKQHNRGFDTHAFDRLLTDQERSARILYDLVPGLWNPGESDPPPSQP